MMNFEEQLNEIRIPCIKEYFKDKSLLNFLKMHINIDYLLHNYNNKNKNSTEKKSLYEKLVEIDQLTDDVLIKELISTIKMQVCNVNENDNDNEKEEKDKKCDETINNGSDFLLSERLNKIFPMGDIEVSNIPNFFNIIKLKENDKPEIFIYSQKLSNTNISKENVEEYYKHIKENNKCGILCNRDAGIYNKDSFEIDIQDNNVNIFIPNHKYDDDIIKLAVKIIYHIYENIKDSSGCIEMDKELLQRLKMEYSYFLTMYNKYLNSMKSNIMSLEKLQLIQLDHFFRRTHITNDDKPYSCQLCGTKFGTDKSLKSHLKIKHQIQLGRKRNKKINKDESENEMEEPEMGLVTFD